MDRQTLRYMREKVNVGEELVDQIDKVIDLKSVLARSENVDEFFRVTVHIKGTTFPMILKAGAIRAIAGDHLDGLREKLAQL